MRVRTAHVSLQWSDSDRQHTQDIEKIFDRAVDRRYAWITGTESGPGADNTSAELIRVAKAHDYRIWVPEHQAEGIASRTDCWIAVRSDLIRSGWKRGYNHVIDGSAQMDREGKPTPEWNGKDRWVPKGITHVSFNGPKELGRVSVAAAHYFTDARTPRSPFWDYNKKLAKELGAWARREGRGPALVFYGGDQNMADDKNGQPQGDTFFGEQFTSAWDELRAWKNTGHGCIDVIASYNKDGRVEAVYADALNDRAFALHTDHFLIEATFRVRPRKS